MTTGDDSLLSLRGADDPDRNGRWMLQTLARLLAGKPEAISEMVHFEELGSDSLGFSTLTEELEQHSGTSITLEDRYDIPTIESFAAVLAQPALKGRAGGHAHC